MSQTDVDEIQRKYIRAKEMLGRGQQSMAEGHKLLRELSATVSNARLRGQINQKIWECERLNGRRVQFFSQSGQDAFLDEQVFKGKRDGVFIEIGGYDGITGSNCLFFELMRGWSGFLVEPSPTFCKAASAFRRATCLNFAIAAEEGEAEFLEVVEGFSQMSGLTASYDPETMETVTADPRHKGQTISVRTQSLENMLDQNFLKAIDYISLDIEGAEMDVLAGFPFEKYDISVWTIENNKGARDIPTLMREKGYKRLEALGVDDVYVKSAD